MLFFTRHTFLYYETTEDTDFVKSLGDPVVEGVNFIARYSEIKVS